MLQPRFRNLWERYCRGVQAIVYVVDSSDLEGLEVCQLRMSRSLNERVAPL